MLWADPDDDTVAWQRRIIEALASGRRRIAYDLKPFSQERATEQIEALYCRAIKRRGK